MTREEEINMARFEYVSKRLANPDFPTYNAEYELEAAFDKGAEWADRHPRWISVDEELPKDFKIVEDSFYAGKFEETDIVMVAFDDGDFGFARYVHDFPNADEGEAWYWFAEGNLSGVNLDDGEITHWLPLPQAPKKGGDQ